MADGGSLALEGRRPPEGLVLLMERLARAAEGGGSAVFFEIERGFAELTGGEARILVNSAGQWRRWSDLEAPTQNPDALRKADPERVMLPIQPGAVAVLLDRDGGEALKEPLALLARGAAMALDLGAGRAIAARSVTELEAMRAVAARILETQDLDEILLLVSHETKRLLAADICGVMLREGDEVVMKSCVGHFSAIMPRLRMQAGVGVAGHVLATGETCVVRDYVESDVITRDFVPLAHIEKVRGALAAPILSRDSVIGVLEVWRRHPTDFAPEDAPLMLALAGLTSIAIDNALLLRARTEAAERLSTAYDELKGRYALIADTAAFQEHVAGLMLLDHSLPRILEATAEFTGGELLCFDEDLHLASASPAPAEEDLKPLRTRLRKADRVGDDAPFLLKIGTRKLYVLPIASQLESLGWLVWAGRGEEAGEPSEGVRLALRHVALAAGLSCSERRRAARQRLGMLENALWGLLSGELVERTAAYDRAREMRAHLRGAVFMAALALPMRISSRGADVDPVWRERILAATEHEALTGIVGMAGIRGDRLCLVCAGEPDPERVAALEGLRKRLQEDLREAAIPLGVSGGHVDWRSLPSAFREAQVALEVARSRPQDSRALYGELGLMGLIINLRDKADLRRVGEEILGGIMAEPEQSRRTLLETLKAFFDCDCAQTAAAARLNVHSKTIAYRLAKIESLTGLELARHQDRVMADIGLRLIALLEEGAADRRS